MSIALFGLGDSKLFAQKVSRYLSVPLSGTYEKDFDDGEVYLRPDVNIRGKDVYVIYSLYSTEKKTAGAKLWELAQFCGACRDASAGRITAVCPYMAFSRQDRKTESRAPISTKYVAEILEAVGIQRLVTMDIHSLSAFQNAFRIPTDNLEAKKILARAIRQQFSDAALITILSPDVGGAARARAFRDELERLFETQIPVAYLDKIRKAHSSLPGGPPVSIHGIVGDVEDRQVIIVDDMIVSGGTIKKCQEAVAQHGGSLQVVAATHGLFIGDASENLSEVVEVCVTDTIHEKRLNHNRIITVDTSELFALSIRRNHDGDSISELLK